MASRTRETVTPAQATTAAAALRAFWESGHRSQLRVRRRAELKKDYFRHGTKAEIREGEAGREKLNPDTLAKAWRVADEYTAEEIGVLCDLVEECVSRFSVSHLLKLLAVRDRARRDRLTRTAIRKRWSVPQVLRAVQAAQGRREWVGNRPKLPKGKLHLLAALVGLTLRWERWCEAAADRLPDDVTEAVERATAAVARVRRAAAAKLPASRYDRGERTGQSRGMRP